jgi:hypothetical protein
MSRHLKILLDKARKSDDADAIKIYHQILAEAPTDDEAHFNLGLIYKRQQNWEKSFLHNQKAAIFDPSHDGSWWNLGMAATMLKEWRVARQAWNHFGLKYEDSDDEITGQIGITPVRTNPQGEHSEVIWCKRIDPARTMIENVPTLASNRHFGDILLNDGAPNGFRKVNGQEYAVFDEVVVIQKSEYLTYEILIEGSNAAEIKAFERICEGYGVECEDWTANIRLLCKQCSEGRPHKEHDRKLAQPDGVFRLGLAAKNRAQIDQIFESWTMKTLNKQIEILNFG